MGLNDIVKKKILENVLRPLNKKGQFNVLVLDQLSKRIISSSCKMSDITPEGITLVEDLTKSRQPLRFVAAIYLITPTDESIRHLMRDFNSSGELMYKEAHVFFTEACPDILFNDLCKHSVSKYIKTLKEINTAFLPHESQVFSLDSPMSLQIFYGPTRQGIRVEHQERIAEQIATVCATLGEYPSIRYRREFDRMGDFVQTVHRKLEQYKADNPGLGEGTEKQKSVLLILDRGFDPVSPLLHELTFQAMAYDLLPIENDVFKYQSSSELGVAEKEAILDDSDEMWTILRHEHIAKVSSMVHDKIKKFTKERRLGKGGDEKMSMRDLSQMLKKMPQYQKELTNYITHFNLASSCMEKYKGHIDKLCKVEQDLAMGLDLEGEKIRDPMRNIVPVLLDKAVSTYEKMRIISLYIIYKGGITKENLARLVQHACIPVEERSIISNLQLLGVPFAQEGARKKQQAYLVSNRKQRLGSAYDVSRWTPYIKDVMEDCIDDKLDVRSFPLYSAGVRRPASQPTSARTTYSWTLQRDAAKSGPRLIVFVIGGMSYSEMRCAYEVTQQYSKNNWEVYIGSTHILRPEGFLSQLNDLSNQTDSSVLTPS